MHNEPHTEKRPTEVPPCTDGREAEEQQLRQLLRMSLLRSRAPQPDIDAAWQTFCHHHPDTSTSKEMAAVPPHAPSIRTDKTANLETIPLGTRRYTLWHLGAAMLTGAVAMWILLLLLPEIPVATSTYVALQHDKAPQRIELEQDTHTLDLTRTDSISFRPTALAPATDAPAGEAPLPHIAQIATTQSNPKPRRLSTPRGMDFKVILPDGSEVWLNAESTIEFPAAFQNGQRRVKLQGEAYFKVSPNEHSPFIVSSNRMDIRVLGTEFNLKSYTSEATHVTLVKGKVEVLRPDSPTPDATLRPGEDAWFDNTGTLHIQDVDTYAVTQWVQGFFYFHDQPLVDVLRELGRWYNYGVIFRNTECMHHHVHFSALRNESIEVALESLNRLRRVHIELEGDNMVVY